jgi:hypothetical protein
MTRVQTDDFSPGQIGDSSTRMSAAITVSKSAGQSSRSQPCSVMSGLRRALERAVDVDGTQI